MSAPFSTKSHVFHKFIFVLEIFTFSEKHAQNLNAHSEEFGELGLTAGI